MGKVEKLITIEELKDRWDWLSHCGVEKLRVTEDFMKSGLHTCEVYGLKMDLEDEHACCYDENDLLINNESVLMLFLQKSLLSIRLLFAGDYVKEILEFGDGMVYVEKC